MPRNYLKISELQPNTKAEGVLLMQNHQLRPKKDGSHFLTMALRDATGKITAVMWDNFAAVTSGNIKDNDYVEVSGEVLTYNNQLQFKLNKISKVPDSEVDCTHFLPICPVPAQEMEAELCNRIGEIEDQDYLALIQMVFGNKFFMEKFRRAPSAVSMHQAYIGGLMEHTLCVVRNALKMADNYPLANRSLLITGGLLHDIGKIVEFSYEKKIAYSDAGRLLGHISIGNAMVENFCCKMEEFPMAKKILLQHMILSHHGHLEFGSPKKPATLEALILHHADILDAQMSNFMEFAANCSKTGARWEYSAMFENHMFASNEVMDEGATLEDIRVRLYSSPPAQLGPETLSGNVVPSNVLLESLSKTDL